MEIPIGNIYYLLAYAWGHLQDQDTVDASEIQGLDRAQDLLGLVLSRGVSRLVHRGIDRGYQERREDLRGVRGRIDLSEYASRALQARMLVPCVHEELSVDVLHNRILRSTLGLLLRIEELDDGVRSSVRRAYRELDEVSELRLHRGLFGQVQLDRNRRDYRFLLRLCHLVFDSSSPDEQRGDVQFHDFRRDEGRMFALFEDFVRGFYEREQSEFSVNGTSRRIPWSDSHGESDADTDYIPRMEADVLLDGEDRRIILDAKYYRQAFQSRDGSWPKIRSGHLYQLLAYLRNREAQWPYGPRHEGVLLYPIVEYAIGAAVVLEGYRIRAIGVDLSRPWSEIHSGLLDVLVS